MHQDEVPSLPSNKAATLDWFNRDVIRGEVELPIREFMYTLDQIAYMLDTTIPILQKSLYYRGRSRGSNRGMLVAVNISLPQQRPEWRVPENNFITWMTYHKISYSGGLKRTFRKK